MLATIDDGKRCHEAAAANAAAAVKIVDSGASHSLQPTAEGLVNVVPTAGPNIADISGNRVDIVAKGDNADLVKKGLPSSASKVYVAPGAGISVVAEGPLLQAGVDRVRSKFDTNLFTWVFQGKPIIQARLHSDTGTLDVVEVVPTASRRRSSFHKLRKEQEFKESALMLQAAKATKLWSSVSNDGTHMLVLLLHCALGHASESSMIEVVEKKLIDNLPRELTPQAIRKFFPKNCIPCIRGKGKTESSTHVKKPDSPRPEPQAPKKLGNLFELLRIEDAVEDESSSEHVCSDEGEKRRDQGESQASVPTEKATKQGEQQALVPRPANTPWLRPRKPKTAAPVVAAPTVAAVDSDSGQSPSQSSHIATKLDAKGAPPTPIQQLFTRGVYPVKGVVPKTRQVLPDTVSLDISQVASTVSGKKVGSTELLHVSSGGHTHVAVFRSMRESYIKQYPLKTLEQLEDTVDTFLDEAWSRGKYVTALKIDNQFATDAIKKTLLSFDCKPEICPPHEHFGNGHAENAVQLLDATARTLIHGADARYPAHERWHMAYANAELTLNLRLTSHSNPFMTAFEAWHGYRPDWHDIPLLPFGCAVEGLHHSRGLSKLDARTFAGFYELPSLDHSQTVQIYDPESKGTKLRRSYWVTGTPLDVVVVDLRSEAPSPIPLPTTSAVNSRKNRRKALLKSRRALAKRESQCHFCGKQWAAAEKKADTLAAKHDRLGQPGVFGEEWTQCDFQEPGADGAICGVWCCSECNAKGQLDRHEAAHFAPSSSVEMEPPQHRYSTRTRTAKRNAAKQLNVAVAQAAAEARRKDCSELHGDLYATRVGLALAAVDAPDLFKPMLAKIGLPEYEEAALADFVAAYVDDPRGYKHMLKHPRAADFIKAAHDEVAGLEEHGTWQYVDRNAVPAGAKIFDSMFVFKTKRDAVGYFLKFKARLTLRGDQQDEFGDTWAPCVHAETVRFLLALAARLDLNVSSMDIAKAFVTESIPDDMEDVYMRLPIAHTKVERIVKLLKSLYGLCEAPRIFHAGLRKYLVEQGYKASAFDQCLFSKREADGSYIWAAVHVDDILVFSSSDAKRDEFRAMMQAKYDLTWNDEAESFLGYSISRDRPNRVLKISQPAYARYIVQAAGLEHASIAPSPGDPLAPYGESKGKGDATRMRKLVGLLQYLTNTRVDILCELNKAAKRMADPTLEDITAAERIVRYVHGTADFGITFSGTGPVQIVAYADASFQNEKGGYSRSSIVFSLGQDNGAFLAKSFTQAYLALSTQHAEVQALSEAARFAVYFRNISTELGFPQEAIVIFEDNNAAIAFAKGESEFDRSKHILQQHRYCVEQQSLGTIKVEKIDTKLQRADQGTKILESAEHSVHTARNLNLSSDKFASNPSTLPDPRSSA